MSDRSGRSGDPPQLHIWDETIREFEMGTLADEGVADEGGRWTVVVMSERAAVDLCRGRISFRRDEERYDTDAILLEENEQEMVKRATELPASTLRQLLAALRSD